MRRRIAALTLIVGAMLWLVGTMQQDETVGSAPPTAPTAFALATRPAASRSTSHVRTSPALRVTLVGSVHSRTGRALADARVCASRTRTGAEPRDVRQVVCTATGNDGAYRIETLAHGTYSASASAAGHLPSAVESPSGLQQEFAIPADEGPVRMNFVLVEGSPEVRGSVQDIQGGPIVGAHVYAIDSAGTRATTAQTESREEGLFDLATGAGTFLLRIVAEGYVETRRLTTAPAEGLVVELTAAAHIAGEVVDADGTPIVGAQVTAAGHGEEPDTIARSTSDAAGRFAIEGLAAGSYELSAQSAGWYGRAADRIELTVGEAKKNVRLTLEPAAVVSGRVLVLPERAPCARAQVFVVTGPFRASAIADERGQYHLDSVPPGKISAHAWCPGASRRSEPRTIDLTPEGLAQLDLPLQRGASVSGRVVDERGQGLAGLAVLAAPADIPGVGATMPSAPGSPQSAGASANSDSRGHFELRGLAPGQYRVLLEHTPAVQQAVTVVDGTRTPNVVLRQSASGTIRVELRDSSGSAAGDDWVVWAHGDKSVRQGDARGVARFELDGLAPGHYEISAHDAQGSSSEASCEVHPGQTVEITLRVPMRDGAVTGHVVDKRGAAVRDARVHAVSSRGGPLGSRAPRMALSAHDGSFELTGLVRGELYDVVAEEAAAGTALKHAVAPGSTITIALGSSAP